MKNLDWHKILDHLSSLATCETSKHKLKKLTPFEKKSKAKGSFFHIKESKKIIDKGLRPFMESLDLYSLWIRRLEKNATLKTIELKDVRYFCIEAMTLAECFKDSESDFFEELSQEMILAEEPLSAIDQIMTANGEIKTDASEKLFKLFNERKDTIKRVQTSLDKLVKQHELEPVLQDRYVTNREGRWVLPIKRDMQGKFQGIVHASSQSKQTVFMEPQEIIPSNNRIKQVDIEVEEEIERLLTELSNYLFGKLQEFKSTYKVMLDADLWFAKAQLANQLNAKSCVFSDDSIELKQLKHPMLCLTQPKEVVGNDIEFNNNRRILILSGPNAGGKTILLKSVGLAAQMARCGLFICADEGSSLPFFTDLFVGIGDSQSVDDNLSTFAAHLKILNQSTKAKGPTNLILIDEICGSTDPEEGSALARSFIEEYSNNKAFGIITSHLGALKTNWDKGSGITNGSMDFNSEKGPSYQILLGIAGQSLAIQTAKRVGVSDTIINRALEKLSPEYKKYHQDIESIEKVKENLSEIKKTLQDKVKEANLQKSQYEAKLLNLEKDKEKILARFLKQAENVVDQTIAEKSVTHVFKKHETMQEIKKQMPTVVKASSTSTALLNADDFSKRFGPGSKIYISTLNQDGIIQSLPNKKGEVEVLSKSMRLNVLWSDLRAPHGATNPAKTILQNKSLKAELASHFDNNLDVRGLTVEEALSAIEVSLDNAALASEDRLKIIHGHGKDVLKRSIRSFLSRSLYVKSWKAGTAHSGGDGVTWAEL